jgi:ribosomal protein S18 acetylase RimI-like enzyme
MIYLFFRCFLIIERNHESRLACFPSGRSRCSEHGFPLRIGLGIGDIDHNESAVSMAIRIAKVLKDKPDAAYTVIRNPNTQEVVAVAGWTLPTDEEDAHQETPEEQEERQALDTELYIKSMPPPSNKDLILEFMTGLRRLRTQILQGEKHYYLNNIATHPDYRGQGLASRLIEHMLRQADAENTVMYLETSSDNSAMRIYKRLGFEEQGKFVIEDVGKFASREEMERCGAGTEHTHIAYWRRPRGRIV